MRDTEGVNNAGQAKTAATVTGWNSVKASFVQVAIEYQIGTDMGRFSVSLG